MTPVEAAVKIVDAIKADPDFAQPVADMVATAGCADIYEWVNKHPDFAIALAEQLGDIDGQISNMDYLLSQGDLS